MACGQRGAAVDLDGYGRNRAARADLDDQGIDGVSPEEQAVVERIAAIFA